MLGRQIVVVWQNRLDGFTRVLPLASSWARAIARRAPVPAQRLVRSALREMARRWPLLARLLEQEPRERTAAPPAGVPVGADLASRYAPRDGQTTAELIAQLRDPSAEVAVQAVESLQRHPAELVTPALRELLDNRDSYFSSAARSAAVRALGQLLPAGESDALAVAATDGDASVSLAAIGALVERGEERSADVLLRLLEDRTGFYLALTRQAAARGLARLRRGDESRVSALLERESDSVVRQVLGRALS